MSPLYMAIKRELHQVSALLQQQDPNAMKNLLHIACRLKDNKMVQILIKYKGVQLNQQDSEDCTPMYYAIQNKNELVIELLIKSGVKLGDKIGRKNTLLHIACKKGDLVVVEFLLSRKVSLFGFD